MSRPISSFFNKIPKRAKQLESINLNAVEHKVGDALKLDQQLESTLDNKVELKDAADQFKLKDSLETKKELDTANNDTISSQQGGLLYRDLCKVFEKIENTTKRLEIQQYLTDYFVSVIKSSKSELVTCIYLCLNKLGPEYLGKELGIGEGLLIKAIANSTGRKVSLIKSEMAIKGDLGLIAQSSRSTQKLFSKPKPISITHLFSSLKKISEFTGNQSQQKKIDEIQKLIVAGVEQEPKYLIRSLEGKLRIGLAQQTVLISLAHASVLSKNPKASSDQLQLAVSNLKQVYSTTPNFDTIIPVLLEFGHENLESKCQLTPGVPLKPMLAHPTKSLTEVLDRFEGHSFTCEYKYDGERVQIHKFDDQVQIYSRNSEDLSLKYPDIIARITSLFKNISSFVIDAEAVAFNNESQSILPFQVLSTRKRKNVTEEDIAVQVCVYAFDLLYFEGKSIVQDTFRNRRNLLRTNFQETNGLFMFAKSNDSNVVDDIQTFLDQSIAGITY